MKLEFKRKSKWKENPIEIRSAQLCEIPVKLSNILDTNHNHVFTLSVINDIISNHPEIIEDKYLILWSDNCQGQYKFKYTFHQMKELARKFNIIVAWFYRETGHRKGLADATSSFGCKQPITNAIITEGKWFQNASEIVSYLKEHFSDDPSKEHHQIDGASLAERRKLEANKDILNPCRKFHLIVINSSGSFKKKLCYTEPNVLDNIIHTDEVEEENYEDYDQEYTNAYSLHQNTVFELLEPSTFVGLRSPPNAIEPFFIAQILSKGLAEKNIMNLVTLLLQGKCMERWYIYKNKKKPTKLFSFVPTKCLWETSLYLKI